MPAPTTQQILARAKVERTPAGKEKTKKEQAKALEESTAQDAIKKIKAEKTELINHIHAIKIAELDNKGVKEIKELSLPRQQQLQFLEAVVESVKKTPPAQATAILRGALHLVTEQIKKSYDGYRLIRITEHRSFLFTAISALITTGQFNAENDKKAFADFEKKLTKPKHAIIKAFVAAHNPTPSSLGFFATKPSSKPDLQDKEAAPAGLTAC